MRSLEKARSCDAAVALEKARMLYGTGPRGHFQSPVSQTQRQNVQLESQLLTTQLNALPKIVNTPPITEGMRMKREMQALLDREASTDFVRFFPVLCVPVSGDYLNASMPKPSTRCQLPNRPDFPIFPV